MEKLEVRIIGGGSWGTALGKVLAEKGYPIKILVRKKEVEESINRHRENVYYFPGIKLPENLEATLSLENFFDKPSLLIWAIPSHALKETILKVRNFKKQVMYHVSAIKGIDIETQKRPSQLLEEAFDEKNIFVLGGPSFAKEVIIGLPTAIVLSGKKEEALKFLQRVFSASFLRVYINLDPVGVEIAGALKNVIAIATGICDGLSLGLNARAALITRGLREIIRFGKKLGAKEETFYGLAGVGDLVLTCTGNLSRNYQVGYLLGKGKSLEKVQREVKQVAEGVRTVKIVRFLARKFGVEMPITEEVYKVIYEGESPLNSLKRLLSRSLKPEY